MAFHLIFVTRVSVNSIPGTFIFLRCLILWCGMFSNHSISLLLFALVPFAHCLPGVFARGLLFCAFSRFRLSRLTLAGRFLLIGHFVCHVRPFSISSDRSLLSIWFHGGRYAPDR